MPETDLDLVEAQRSLDGFLVDNEELENLNARLSEFNLFNVLRIEKAEIRHSNVLAWLLSPDETHGLGPIFLRRFLARLLMTHRFDGVSISAAQVELMPFGDIEVYRERHNIDILVRCRTTRWCLLIENKILSRESPGQLAHYRRAVEREFPDDQIIPVYLTLDGDEPSADGYEAGFVPHGHQQVLELAEQIERQHAARIPADAHVLIKHYLVTLRRLTMQDQEIVDLCKSIYRKHRQAIDLIVEYGASSQVLASCETVLAEVVPCEFIQTARGMLWFVPKQMGAVVPSVELNDWKWLPRSVPVSCWYLYRRKRGTLQVSLEIGPIADPARRSALVVAAEEFGFKVRADAVKEGTKFTRLVSESQRLRKDENGEPDESDDYIQDVARRLWQKFWPQVTGFLPALEAALQTESNVTK